MIINWSAEFCREVLAKHPLREDDECIACGMVGANHGRPVASPCDPYTMATARLAELGEPVPAGTNIATAGHDDEGIAP